MNGVVLTLLIAAALLCGSLLMVEVGQHLGRKRKREAAATTQLGTLQGAVLGLLALLLGFSFSGASTRFVERQDLIVREANAIGTAYLRADLLDEPQRTALRTALRAYTQARVDAFNAPGISGMDDALTRSALLHTPIWKAGMAGVQAAPHNTIALLNPINDIIDMHSIRLAALHRHLPMLVLVCLLASAAAALFIVGYGDGLTGHRNRAMTTGLSLLVAIVMWVTIDLDYPRQGLIQINQFSMEQLLRDIGGEGEGK